MNENDFFSLLEEYIYLSEKLQLINEDQVSAIKGLLQILDILRTENQFFHSDSLVSYYDTLVKICHHLEMQHEFYNSMIQETKYLKGLFEGYDSSSSSKAFYCRPSISSFLGSLTSHRQSSSLISFKGSNEERKQHEATQNACDVPSEEKPPVDPSSNVPPVSKVYFSAVAPHIFNPGKSGLIDLFMYEEAFRSVVDEVIDSADDPVRETKFSPQKVPENASVCIELTSDDLTVEDGCVTQDWLGEYLRFSFQVLVPDSYDKDEIMFKAAVYFNGVKASTLLFHAKCGIGAPQRLRIQQKNILSAFMSYAHQDKERVIAIIQGLKKARSDLDVFFDVDSLRSGADWEKTIYQEIDRRDILYLCWSHFAKESKWVDKEWRYAYSKKGPDFIDPIPMEPYDKSFDPPEELRHKHFDDRLLYLINKQ